MRRREWLIWAGVVVVGVASLVLAYAVIGEHSPWRALGPLGGALVGSGAGQLIRGWWRSRHTRTADLPEGR